MFLIAIVRRFSLVVGLIVACATLAYAGRAATTLEECCGHARGTPTPSRGMSTKLADDQPGWIAHTATAAETTSTHFDPGATPRTTLPLPADSHGRKHDHGRAMPNASVQVHRPATSRSKSMIRSTPATPGMGLLLRFGTSAGREISLEINNLSHAPIAPRPGRAPPRAAPLAVGAPTALPADAASLFAGRRALLGAPASLLARSFRAPRASAKNVGVFTLAGVGSPNAQESTTGSGTDRMKGAAACPCMPFGGRTA
ncbi:MAG TPA: hypothetical protein VMH61_03515 [Candidatus Acidoferrales bacterium]|nr:hypothetical protein [Candidatus Acidoferrales bacterium]